VSAIAAVFNPFLQCTRAICPRTSAWI
jgi:hypothetical protein